MLRAAARELIAGEGFCRPAGPSLRHAKGGLRGKTPTTSAILFLSPYRMCLGRLERLGMQLLARLWELCADGGAQYFSFPDGKGKDATIVSAQRGSKGIKVSARHVGGR